MNKKTRDRHSIFTSLKFFVNRKLLTHRMSEKCAIRNRLIQSELDPNAVVHKVYDISDKHDEYYFNPTIISNHKASQLIIRHVGANGVRRLQYVKLNKKENVLPHPLDKDIGVYKSGQRVSWCADPRAFFFSGETYISFNTGHKEQPNNIYIQPLDSLGNPSNDPIQMVFHGRKAIEKNWGFFEHNGTLYAVYSISPFVVIKVDIDFSRRIANGTVVYRHYWKSDRVEKKYGELRGGASPIKIGNRFYLISQSNTSAMKGVIYTGSIITFNASPPFQPEQTSNEPIFKLTKEEYRRQPIRKLNKKVEACFYPCGATYDSSSGTIHITYGINDYKFGIRTYKLSSIDKLLHDVNFET